jgi:hypothetical protein
MSLLNYRSTSEPKLTPEFCFGLEKIASKRRCSQKCTLRAEQGAKYGSKRRCSQKCTLRAEQGAKYGEQGAKYGVYRVQ